jgi:hypothetical protein
VCTTAGISAVDGYFLEWDAALQLSSHKCLPGYCSACANTTAPADVRVVGGAVLSCCSANRPDAADNPLCGRCLPRHVLFGDGLCVECAEVNGPLLFFVIFATWLYVTGNRTRLVTALSAC